MPIISIAFMCGILLLQQFSFLPNKYWILGIFILVIGLYLLKIQYRSILVAICLGFSWALWYAHHQMLWTLSKDYENKPILITGIVTSIPNESDHKTNFIFKLDKVNNESAHGFARLIWPEENLKLKVGEEWNLPVKLKQMHGTMNPGGFDMEAWSLQQGIRSSGYVVIGKKILPHKIDEHHLRYFIDTVRQYFRDQIAKNLPLSHTSPWITALAIGERKGIDAESWKVLRNTGTNHLMAIAGLHIGFMSAFLYGIVLFIWRRIPYLLLKIPAQHAASFAALLMALIYSAMAGFSIPTQRACLMFSILLIIVLSKRNIKAWYAWSMALVIVLLINPLTVLSESFWLSFGSVALIIYTMKGRLAATGLWWKHGRIQWVIAIGLIPISVWLFKQCSIVSFIANSIAIPWVGFLIVPLTLLGCFLSLLSTPLSGWCLLLADKLLQLLWVILTYLSDLPWSSWYQSIPNSYVLLMACVGVVILLAPAGFFGRWLGLCWMLPMFFYIHNTPKSGEAWFTLLDVGQGLSAVVQTKNHALVFDAGAKWGDNFDMGESVVLPFLHYQGIKKIDMLVVSHGDNDHSGGADAILQQFKVTEIKTSVIKKYSNYHVSYCLRGQAWQWDGVDFAFIYPTLDYLNLGNDSSCVLKISFADKVILLTGDIEKIAEQFLVETNPSELKSTLLVAPHHGSKTSGLDDFIQFVHPDIVLFPIGYLNRYHFPHPTVLHKYKNINAVTADTASAGAIQFKIPDHIDLSFYRENHKHYWYHS